MVIHLVDQAKFTTVWTLTLEFKVSDELLLLINGLGHVRKLSFLVKDVWVIQNFQLK